MVNWSSAIVAIALILALVLPGAPHRNPVWGTETHHGQTAKAAEPQGGWQALGS